MPTKTPKNKIEKPTQPKRRITGAQIVFMIFAVLIIISMILSAISMAS